MTRAVSKLYEWLKQRKLSEVELRWKSIQELKILLEYINTGQINEEEIKRLLHEIKEECELMEEIKTLVQNIEEGGENRVELSRILKKVVKCS